ncbi:formate dehydrogenase subunit gamma [Desulfatitalea alkaliphila]|uniref:Cytochrome b/b6 domain-containing protein n=1 Tax=Desulfatitalea alkaliphila TaxID=2929485 RepID=A0AA41R112_9BACT|nr:cytochrome b/b6 domain-containing protein [Desulfatitalea alkaliphila]MCJ8499596.1 cytochrome b/b6 domain-containing protein [Desulfatitalea alkaliphila]
MQEHHPSETSVIRFSVLHRFLHLVVMVGFTGLAATGLSLAFSASWPARAFMWLMGGSAGAAWVHRACAVITYATVVIHGLWFLYYKWVLRGRLTGPHSILPSLKDLKDLRHNVGYFLGTRPQAPQFDKFSYMEKIDYWAVFIGMNTMGITGLLLWFPEFFTLWLPGFFINLAQVLHFYEALLAIVIKFFIHIGMAHLRPAVYPADMSIFTGRATAAHSGSNPSMKPEQ